MPLSGKNLSRRLAIAYLSFWATVLYLRFFNMIFFREQVQTGIFSWGENLHFHHFIAGFILLGLSFLFEISGIMMMEFVSILLGIALGLIADEFLYWVSYSSNYWDFYNYFGIILISVILLLLYIDASKRENQFWMSFSGKPQVRKNPEQPKISVVIPAYNEGAFLHRALQSLAKQEFQDFEIIVVDNNSADDTTAIAEEYGAKVIRETKQGVSNARQTGFTAAAGEIIATTDADTFLPTNWTKRIAQEFDTNPDLAAFGGLYSLYSGPLSATLIFPDFAYLFWLLDSKFNKAWGLNGSNMAVRKSAFLKTSGFDTSINVGEDADLAKRLSAYGQLKFDRNFLVSTSGRRYRHGLLRGAGSYLKKYKRVRDFNQRLGKKPSGLSVERAERSSAAALLWPMIPAIILIFIFSAKSQALAKSAYLAHQARIKAQQETQEFIQNHPKTIHKLDPDNYGK